MPIPPELLSGPFLASTASRLGVSRQVLRGRRFRRLFRGVYVRADLPVTLDLLARAAMLLLPPGAALSCWTAAALRGLPVPAIVRADSIVHATVPRLGGHSRSRGLVVHEREAVDRVRFDGHTVTPAASTFLECGARGYREHAAGDPDAPGLIDLVVLGDAMVRHGFVTVDDLRCAADGGVAWVPARGISLLRATSRLVRSRVDSPMETRVRLLIMLGGMPCPETGVEILNELGGWIATVDMCFRESKVVVEYDGDLHRTERRKWRHDVLTRDLLRNELGCQVIVLTADDIALRPGETLERIHAALIRRGQPGVRPALNPSWRHYFGPRP